jgi:hypothetical protein
VSEAGQTYPPEGLPARPPSEPSRVPRLIWAGIALFCLLMFGGALGLFLWSRQVGGSRDLKRATSLTISYTVKGAQQKSIAVSDPAEVRDLLDALEITDTQSGLFAAQSAPGGKSARVVFVGPTVLDRSNWGQVHVTRRFYDKVCDVASKAEGRKIDILRSDN